MIDTVLLVVFGIGYVLTWRTTVWAIINSFVFGNRRPAGEDVAFGVFMGSMLNAAWPLIFVGLGVRALYRSRGEDALYALMPRSVRRERELTERQERIAALERELAIKS